MNNTLAMLLAGGKGSRLSVLASKRAKPAIPFGGFYRLIDFSLSNIINSGIDNVGILTQYRSRSLIDHIKTGEVWGFYGRNRSVTILPPYKGKKESSWYKGTADAILQNLSYIRRFDKVKRILILSGDHIYNMNYSKLIKYHKQKKAKLTIVAKYGTVSEAKRFGSIAIDPENKILNFEEKPQNPKNNILSLGIYLFDKDFLVDLLLKDATLKESSRDFGKDIVTRMSKEQVFVYPFTGYWKDVGTIQSYWETSMDLLQNLKGFNLNNWNIRSNHARKTVADRNSAYIDPNSNVINSLISDGCVIEGHVENSILSPGVRVQKDAVIKDSIIFHDSIISNNVSIDKCIIDKEVHIKKNATVGYNKATENTKKSYVGLGVTLIGKGTTIPPNLKIGKSCVVSSSLSEEKFIKKEYDNGEIIKE